MYDTEFRYLTRNSSGLLDLGYLPYDKILDERREAVHYNHRGKLTPRLNDNINISYVSDGDYLSDFGGGLAAATTVNLERNAELNYLGDDWSTQMRLQGYQTLDETIPESSRPYQRLPQILLNTNRPLVKNELNYQLYSEFVNFERQDRVTSERLDIQPVITFPLSTIATYVIPKINLHYTQYYLHDQDPGVENKQYRTIPIFSLDNRVFLEKDSEWGSRKFLQTLEPRLFYLYAPYKDQSDIPIFDSGTPDFNITTMFLENRFSSVDRVGDANQISLSITSRLIESNSGIERLMGSIGQTYYFRDREVTLPGEPVDTSKQSDIFAEASALITTRLATDGDLLWDVENNQISTGDIQFRYRAESRHVINLSYRYRRDVPGQTDGLSQTDFSLLWPLSPAWHIIGRWYYSLLDNQQLDAIAGLEYQSCCWKLQMMTRHYLQQAATADTPVIYDNAFYIQLELKGLAGVGRAMKDILQESILGYVE